MNTENAISPSDVIPQPFLEALTALSREYGFWIQGGELSLMECAPDRSYVCNGFNDRALRLSNERLKGPIEPIDPNRILPRTHYRFVIGD